ncbi:SurA N-terminal domain-containing protein [bacterium]|jgi:parvulin-like peptidyl-prolyl isomerase|nr:SurA N-terminal domain-containing protein [Flavobacteriales bacterium]MDB2436023.1 SurA N-terminal domain-containing protein [Schleiferiaceae bacterium]MDB2505875.1 SurA N-terminal domain-containing protein [bacterium]MDB4337279.1 SurA N-terminal domain-containing protein [bacterium]MDC3183605.1 SurA N-terminal domain-containing protein [Schleiferiaceae bacterium]
MATIQRIRQRSGLLVVVVFVALIAFLLGDLFRSGGSKFFGDPNVIGTVNGRDITRQELSQGMEELRAGNPEQYANTTSIQLANFVWNNIVTEELLSAELSAAGMSVSEQEIYFDIITNPNIRQNFAGANGQFDENMFKSYIAQVRDNRDASEQSVEMWTQWLSFERAVANQAQNFKYTNAIEKAIFMPAGLAETEINRGDAQHPAQYVYVPYIDVNEDEINVSDEDAKRYFNAHKEDFSQEEGRNIEFINFPLAPSESDREGVRAELASLSFEWLNVEDDSVFVNQHSDVRFQSEYYTTTELVGTGLDTLVDGQSVGFQKGPIDLGGAFAVVKLVDRKTVPDSVKARHILIPFAGATRADASVTRNPQEAKVLADSLFAYLEGNPSAFESVSEAFSSDVVAKEKGGDLGYFSRGSMAKPFENFCFFRKNGSMGVVPTQFGWHVIQVTDQKGANDVYKIGQIIREILPSDETIQTLYNQASGYAAEAQTAEDYRALATEKGFFLRPARNLGRFEEVVSGLGTARRVVRWAWDDDREEGNIGLLENDGNGYVVVVLTDKLEEGTSSFEMVQAQCLEAAKKDAKKALVLERLENASAGAATIEAVATAAGKEVRTLSFRISQFNISGVGNEAKVVGTICGLEPGTLSPVILGENGAFVAITSPANPAPQIDYTNMAQNTQRSIRNLVGTQAYKALQDKAKIEDMRYMMF